METTVKTYRNAKEYQRGLQEMIAAGWTKTDVTEKTRPRGCLSIFPVGSDLIVTYQRASAAVPAFEATVRDGHCPNCGTAVAPSTFYCPTCKTQLRS